MSACPTSLKRPALRVASLLPLLALSCTNAQLGVPAPPPVPAADNLLSIDGTVCTQPAADITFPVKLLFLIDLSNSMCYSDPASGACTAARCDQGPNNPATNPTPPRRSVAVQEVLDRFAGTSGVSFSVVTFSSSVTAYPYDTTNPHQIFTSDRSQLHLESLRNVDSVTDYQGALARVKSLLSEDMAAVSQRRKSELPRTKYAVIFLTDGAPFPHCSRATPERNNPPDATTCATSPSTCTICQSGGTATLFPDLGAGQDYNETYQLVQLINEIHKLADSYSVGDLKFHTAQLRVDNAAVCCPGCFADDPSGDFASTLLKTLAQPEQNHGTFTQFTQSQDISFVDYNFTSLQERFATRTLIVENSNAVPTAKGWEVDSDGDGLSDAEEFRLGLDRLLSDSDGDGYSDLFERRRGAPFDALVAQVGRCATHSAKCPNNSFCDTDGDGLKDCEEFEVGTDAELVDSDADGLPDGLEYRRGLDPTTDDTQGDLDFDGIPNLQEVLDGLSPTERDSKAHPDWSLRISLNETRPTSDGRSCYAFAERGLAMPTTLDRSKNGGLPLGWSQTLIWLSEAPRGDLRDFGRFRVACVRSRFVPPSVRLPLDPGVTLKDEDFHDPADFRPERDCKGATP